MNLAEHYPLILLVHVGLALTTGVFFTLRGIAVLLGAAWPQRSAIKRAAMAIDTLLLTAAVLLLTVLKLNPFTTDWLQAKLLMLLGYIVFGVFALKRAKTRAPRAAFFVAALACYAMIVSIARFQHPLGLLTLLR